MHKVMFALAAIVAAVPATFAQAETPAAASQAYTGKVLYSSAGGRLGSIYRVSPEGNPQLILSGRLITVPSSTISDVNGKLTTSLSKRDLHRLL